MSRVRDCSICGKPTRKGERTTAFVRIKRRLPEGGWVTTSDWFYYCDAHTAQEKVRHMAEANLENEAIA